MAEYDSPLFNTDNQYLKYYIAVYETATSVVNNTSTIGIQVIANRTNTGYTTNYSGGCAIKIDGVEQPSQYWNWGEKPVSYESYTDLYWKDYYNVTHDANGTKTMNIAASCWWYSNGSVYIDSAWQSFNVTLTALDRSAPTVSISTSNVGVNSFSLSASSNVTCDRWDRSIDNGSTWTNFSTTSGTSASTTISGLSPNTTYNVKVRGRKSSNQVYGTSGTSSVKTIGNSVLNSVNTVTADNSTVSFTINATVYVPSYTHKLEIKNGNTSILTKTGLTLANGNNTITLTAAERTTLLNAMSTIKSFTGTFNLSTWSGNTQIGSTTSKTATVQTTASNSAPTFTGFTYVDSNNISTAVTENNQVLIQGISTITVTANAATAKNSATIKSYSLSFGSTTASSTTTTITTGAVTNTGTVTLTVSAVDSRGYSTSRSVNVTVVPYSKIKFNTETIRRVNEVENTIQLSFTGTIQPITVSSVDKNSLQVCKYRYKKTSDADYGSYTDITSGVTRSGNNLSYSNNSLVALDANYSWNIQVYLQDRLTNDTVTLTVGQGTPLMSWRTKKVGINQKNPSEALDAVGNAKFTGTVTSSYKSASWVNSLNNSAFNVTDASGSYGGWICGPTKNGRIAISTYQADNDNIYLGYGERGRTTNSFAKKIFWNGSTGNMETDGFIVLNNNGTAMATSAGKVSDLGAGQSRVYKNAFVMSNPATANDQAWIRTLGSSESDTVLELATGDDGGGGEAIVVRQYNTSNNVARQATLLGTDGHARFPSYVFCNYLNISCGNDNGATSSSYALYANSDNYLRKCSMSKLHSALGGSGCVQLYSGNLGKGSQTSFNYGSYSEYVVIFRIDGVDSGFVLAVFPKGKLGTSAQWHGYSYDGYNWADVAMWYSGSTAYVKVDGSNPNTQVRWVYGLY